METDTKKIIANLEFRSNTDALKGVSNFINRMSSEISNLNKQIASIRVGPLTDINKQIVEQLKVVNPLNKALTTMRTINAKPDEKRTPIDTEALKKAQEDLKKLTGQMELPKAIRQADKDIFIGKNQLVAFRQKKSEIIAGLQELIAKKNQLIAQRGELKIEMGMVGEQFKEKPDIFGSIVKTQAVYADKTINETRDKQIQASADSLAQSIKDRYTKVAVEQKAAQMEIKEIQSKAMAEQKASLDSLKLSEARNKQSRQLANEEFRALKSRLTAEGKDVVSTQKAQIDTENLEIAQDLMRRTGLEANALNIGLKRLGMTIKGGKIMGPFNQELKVTQVNLKKLKAASVQFKMSLLSVMFAGMALQRVSGRMLRSFVTTFQKANEDTEGLGKATWQLQAAWEFLKYSMMDALLQSDLFKLLVEWAIKLIMWFNQLPASTKAFIMIGIVILWVVGTVMLLIGQIGLFINGLAAMGIGNTILASLGAMFWWLALIVGLVIALWVSDLGNFREFFKQTFGILGLIVKTIFGYIFGIIKNVLKLVKALFKGDFDEVYKIIVNMWKNSLAFTLKILYALSAAVDNVGKWMINVLVDVAQLGVNTLIAAVNLLIRGINSIPLINLEIPELPAVDFSSYKQAYTTLDDVKGKFDEINKSIGIDSLLAEVPQINPPVTSDESARIDNSTKNFELNFTMPEGVTDIDSLSDKVLEKLNDTYSRSNDSGL